MNNKNRVLKIITTLAIYAIAMALVEAAAIVYLRVLYYPAGFYIKGAKDLSVIPGSILTVELWREVATIIMLLVVGYLAFSGPKKRFAAFLFAFSIWDLAYYLFLYVFLRWPSTLSTIDVYFLIPWPWIGPVWFPLILFSMLAIISLWFIIKSNHES